MKGAALPRLSTALRAVLHALRSLRPRRGDRLTLLILTGVADDRQAIILRPPDRGDVRRLWQGKAPEMRMSVVQALNSGGPSRGSIVRAAGSSCPVHLHVLGSDRPERLHRAAATPREPDLLLP